MARWRIDRRQTSLGAVEPEDRPGRRDRLLDSFHVEVVVLLGGNREKGTRRQCGDQLGEIEGDKVRIVVELRSDARHVARTGPTGHVILVEGAKPATGHHGLHPGVEEAEEDGVVAAQRVAEDADPLGIHLGARLQQVDGPEMVPDALHRAAGVAVCGSEVVGVFAQGRIVGRQGHVAALGQFQGVLQVRISGQPGGFGLAVPGRLVQAQHRGTTRPGSRLGSPQAGTSTRGRDRRGPTGSSA